MTTAAGSVPRRSRRRSSCRTGSWMRTRRGCSGCCPAGPGPDVSTEAVAELTGWPAHQARAAIGRLVRAHLVEPGGVRGRWRMHDLLRLYARQLPDTSPGEREQAVGRLLAWYLRHARAADDHLRALAGMPAPAEFTSRDDALAWLDAERPGLIAAVTMAAATGRHQEAMRLPLNLSEYLAVAAAVR